MRAVLFVVLAFFTLFLNEARSQAVIISAPRVWTNECGGHDIRPSFTVTPVKLKNLDREKKRIWGEIKATGASPVVSEVKPGQSYAIALVTKKTIDKRKECTWTSVIWEVETGKGAVEKLERTVKGVAYYSKHSISEAKVLK